MVCELEYMNMCPPPQLSSLLRHWAGESEVPRTSRCRLLQTVAKSVKPNIHLPLTSRHKTKRVEWAGII